MLEKHTTKSHLPKFILRADRSDISCPERGAGHSTAWMKLIGVSSIYQILKFAYIFIHAVNGLPLSVVHQNVASRSSQKQAVSVKCLGGNPPLIAGASTTICTSFISRAVPLCPNLEGTLCPTLTAHTEPLPFSELAETRSRQTIHISIRVLG